MLAYEVKGLWGAACRRWGLTADGPFERMGFALAIPFANYEGGPTKANND
jgi:hypothetical protein